MAQFFFLAQVRHFSCCPKVRSGSTLRMLPITHFLDTSVLYTVAVADASSLSPLLVKLPKFLNRLCLTIFPRLWSLPLYVHQSIFHEYGLIQHLTATPFTSDLLWRTLLVVVVTECFLDTCEVSSLLRHCD